MQTQEKIHWENIYNTKADGEVSWFQIYPETSIEFIELGSLPLRLMSQTSVEATVILQMRCRQRLPKHFKYRIYQPMPGNNKADEPFCCKRKNLLAAPKAAYKELKKLSTPKAA